MSGEPPGTGVPNGLVGTLQSQVQTLTLKKGNSSRGGGGAISSGSQLPPSGPSSSGSQPQPPQGQSGLSRSKSNASSIPVPKTRIVRKGEGQPPPPEPAPAAPPVKVVKQSPFKVQISGPDFSISINQNGSSTTKKQGSKKSPKEQEVSDVKVEAQEVKDEVKGQPTSKIPRKKSIRLPNAPDLVVAVSPSAGGASSGGGPSSSPPDLSTGPEDSENNDGTSSDPSGEGSKSKDGQFNFTFYIQKIMKEVRPELTIAVDTVGELNRFLNGIMGRILSRATGLWDKAAAAAAALALGEAKLSTLTQGITRHCGGGGFSGRRPGGVQGHGQGQGGGDNNGSSRVPDAPPREPGDGDAEDEDEEEDEDDDEADDSADTTIEVKGSNPFDLKEDLDVSSSD